MMNKNDFKTARRLRGTCKSHTTGESAFYAKYSSELNDVVEKNCWECEKRLRFICASKHTHRELLSAYIYVSFNLFLVF